ncbi:hypothetical protein J6590_107470 [Homalodisca vitripennis]|nr:hypothetical protein J6590_107470 [Homalodisca vitripennis]
MDDVEYQTDSEVEDPYYETNSRQWSAHKRSTKHMTAEYRCTSQNMLYTPEKTQSFSFSGAYTTPFYKKRTSVLRFRRPREMTSHWRMGQWRQNVKEQGERLACYYQTDPASPDAQDH